MSGKEFPNMPPAVTVPTFSEAAFELGIKSSNVPGLSSIMLSNLTLGIGVR